MSQFSQFIQLFHRKTVTFGYILNMVIKEKQFRKRKEKDVRYNQGC